MVVTWGFLPNEDQIGHVNLFKDKGFDLIWLDGDRNSAFREFIARDSLYGKVYLDRQIEAFNTQLKRIGDTGVINIIKPKIINTFDSKHQFRKLEEIANDIKSE